MSHWLTLHELGGLPEFKMADCEPEVHCIPGMAVDIREITTANPTFSTMTDSLATLPTLPDVGRLPEFKMADYKPEVDCISGMEGIISEIPTANPTFSTMTDSLAILPTLPDVEGLPEFKMADCKPEVDCISGMEGVISEITTANLTFSTTTDSLLTPPITATRLSSSA